MCGLFGILGPGIIRNDLDMLQDIAYISGLRGLDATGVLQVRNKGYGQDPEYIVEKSSNDISYFKWFHENHSEGNKKIMNDIYCHLIAGHVRAATRGHLTEENAHPFDLENIIGMHNGTVHGDEFKHETKTDSELLLSAIDQNGVEILSDLTNRDAYAIVIYNKNTNKVTFVRNHLRPLWFAVHAKRHVMYWASEDWMIRSIFKRHNEEIKGNILFYLKPGLAYSLTPDEFSNRKDSYFEIESITNSKTDPVKKEESKSTPQKKETKQEAEEEKGGDEGKISKNVTFLSKPIAKDKRRVRHINCAGCNESLSLFQQYKARSYGGNTLICAECQKDFFTNETDTEKPNYLH